MGAELTVRQKILVSASALVADTEPFSVEELIVKTWTLFPEAFSLRGYTSIYPDSNRVLAKLSGSDGLCGMGWLEHVDSRMYRVTRKGRVLSKQLVSSQPGSSTAPPPAVAMPVAPVPPAPHPVEKVERAPRPVREKVVAEKPRPQPEAPPVATVVVAQLSPKDIYALEQVVKADALRKFLRGQSLSFTDACAFWGFTASSRPAAIQQRIDETSDLLKRAVESFGTEGGPAPRMPNLSTCFGLLNLHRLMVEKFTRELDALRTPAAVG